MASKLVDKLPIGKGMFSGNFIFGYYKNKGINQDSFKFSPVGVDEVSTLLGKMNSKKATGLDNIPAKFVKEGASVIAHPFSHIVNLSLFSGLVPEEMKSARVVPLYKKNKKTDCSNYRPVSILTIMSNILERAVYTQVEDHLKTHKLFYKFQSGFRTSYSTDSCLTYLTDFIRFQMDRGFFVGMVMIDLQKAFDTVDHSIILQKLKALGFNDTSVSWFDSYLRDRKQQVDINGVLSGPRVVPCGVPQGSILGPLLFLIYVNDMEASVDCDLILYADDSALLVSDRDPDVIGKKLGVELAALHSWLVDNKLSLHLGKTESILFGSRGKLKNCHTLDVLYNGSNISPKQSVRYLGVDLDQSLDGISIVDNLMKKVNSRLKFLRRQAKCLNFRSKKLLASALIQCHFDYACSAWYNGLQKGFQQKLQILQNKTIRFVLDLSPRSHIGVSEFHKLNWLPIHERVQQIMVNNIHRIVYGDAPPYLGEGIVMVNELHNFNTRNSKLSIVLPYVKYAGLKSFRYAASRAWNSPFLLSH